MEIKRIMMGILAVSLSGMVRPGIAKSINWKEGVSKNAGDVLSGLAPQGFGSGFSLITSNQPNFHSGIKAHTIRSNSCTACSSGCASTCGGGCASGAKS
jgi:hypothetical protein